MEQDGSSFNAILTCESICCCDGLCGLNLLGLVKYLLMCSEQQISRIIGVNYLCIILYIRIICPMQRDIL